VLKAFQLGRAQGKLTVYDPNYRSRFWVHRDHAIEAMVEILPYVDILLPSFEDLQGLLDITDLPHMLEYFQLRDVPMVALKQGTEGVTLAFRRQQHHISAIPAPVLVDTIGAGDAFNGGFLWGMLQKRSLVQCAELGVQVASLSLGGRGPIAGLPGPQELAGKALSHYVS
jgi:2-dehydro-3-deoxygluconokinase